MPTRIKRHARRLSDDRLFKPAGVKKTDLMVNTLNLDEFEAIRLVDYEDLSQIDAANDMEVSRRTIQRLLHTGRKKIVEAILYNKAIEVKNDIDDIKLKGENRINMENKSRKIIAFPTSDRVTVDGHFGHTKEFALYIIEDNVVSEINFVTPPPHEPGVLPKFLASNDVDVIVTGGMGRMAINLFKQNNIEVILGAAGTMNQNLKEYLGGSLESTGSACSHEHGEHHGH